MVQNITSGDKWRCYHADGRTDEQTSENRATQSLDSVRLSFAIQILEYVISLDVVKLIQMMVMV